VNITPLTWADCAMAARERDILGHLGKPAAERPERPLQAALLVHDRLLPGEMPDARCSNFAD
jgi:hypothetical protein